MYPNCPAITRTVTVGGLTKSELIQELQRNAISMNESGERLFASDQFTTSATRYSVTTVELTVRDLGFPRGTTIAEIYVSAKALGLSLCPIELGPHLRLQYLDQPEGYEGKPVRQHQAPYGSITIALSAEPGTQPAKRRIVEQSYDKVVLYCIDHVCVRRSCSVRQLRWMNHP